MGVRPRPVPAHHEPRLLAAVALGGTIGTAARAALGSALPVAPGSWPWTTFTINLLGALLLGALLEILARGGEDRGIRRLLRLGLGTGMLGGFTTYSTLSVEAARLWGGGAGLLAAGYGLASVAGGLAAAWAGFQLGRAFSRGAGALRRGAES